MLRVLPLFALATVVAAAQDVRYDYDKDKDFSRYHSYKWVTINGADQADQLTAKKIVAAVDLQLSSKGLSKTDGENADLYICYQTALGQEKEFVSYNTGWNHGPGWGPSWYWFGGAMPPRTTYGSTSTVYVGQLDVSIYDTTSKQLIWRGQTSKSLDPNAKPEKVEKEINKGVQKLLKNFPPAPKK